jgi:glycosyltransferase involved in cell wall biosynthesis
MPNPSCRVIIFSMSYYPRFVGGAEVAIKEITDRIEECEFHLVTLRYDSTLPRYEKIGNVHVYRIGFTTQSPTLAALRTVPLRLNKLLYQFYAPLYALYLHRTKRFDTAWSMMAHSAGVPGNIFSFLTRRPLVLSLQEGDPVEHIEKQMRLFGPLFSTVFTRATHVQAISTFLAQWALEKGADKNRVSVVPNAVDVHVFTYKAKEPTTHIKRIITTSRLVPKNGVDTLIEAMSFLPPHFHLDIVGDGFEREHLEAHARALGLQERVVFHGHKSQLEIVDMLHASFVFCRPSRSEGLGNSFLEAMATGTPVIATPVGGIVDFLVDAQKNAVKGNAFFCREANSQSVANTILFVETYPKDLLERVCKRARMHIEQSCSWSDVANSIRNLF